MRGNVKLEFVQTNHLEKYLEYAEKAEINARSFSVIVWERNKKFFFSSDVSSIDEIMQHLDGSLSLIEAAHPTLEEIAEISKRTDVITFSSLTFRKNSRAVERGERNCAQSSELKKLNIVHDGQVLKI